MTAPPSRAFRSGPAIAAVFQRWRERKGQSKQDLALRAGVPLSVVEAVESGRSAEVELPDLQALVVELDGDVQELMSDPTDA